MPVSSEIMLSIWLVSLLMKCWSELKPGNFSVQSQFDPSHRICKEEVYGSTDDEECTCYQSRWRWAKLPGLGGSLASSSWRCGSSEDISSACCGCWRRRYCGGSTHSYTRSPTDAEPESFQGGVAGMITVFRMSHPVSSFFVWGYNTNSELMQIAITGGILFFDSLLFVPLLTKANADQNVFSIHCCTSYLCPLHWTEKH